MVIFTDGSANPNPGPGGFGVVAIDKEEKVIHAHAHHEQETTNNRQEIKAILFAYIMWGAKPDDFGVEIPIVYSDSSYAVNTFNSWMFNWANAGWKKSDNKIPENLDLIQEYYDWYQKGYRIDLRKVKGHAGTFGNELADDLAANRITPQEVMEKYGRN